MDENKTITISREKFTDVSADVIARNALAMLASKEMDSERAADFTMKAAEIIAVITKKLFVEEEET